MSSLKLYIHSHSTFFLQACTKSQYCIKVHLSLCSARKTANKGSDLLKLAKLNRIEKQYLGQKQSLYDTNELKSHQLLRPPLFFNIA